MIVTLLLVVVSMYLAVVAASPKGLALDQKWIKSLTFGGRHSSVEQLCAYHRAVRGLRPQYNIIYF